jgi:S-adenosylmethionine/arginine decarboxylase-like enzyme
MKPMNIIHHHLIIQTEVKQFYGEDKHDDLKSFLLDLVKEIKMECLIEPQLKFSHQKAWTGIIGIVTSHISFHYWTVEKYLQFDIYSCKKFSTENAIKFIHKFWELGQSKSIFIEREPDKDFEIRNINPNDYLK